MTPLHRRWAPLLVAALLATSACSDGGGEPDFGDASDDPPVELATAPGFDGAALRVGVILPGGGPVAEVAAERATGLKAYLDYVTTELGGIGTKYPVVLDVRDSAGLDAEELADLATDLRADTVLLAQVQGRAAVEAARPAVADDGVAVPGVAEVAWVQDPSLIAVGTPDALAAANALTWLLTATGNDPDATVCSAVQEGSDAEGWQRGLEHAAGADGLDHPLAATVTIPAAPEAPDGVGPQVAALVAAGCDQVLLFAGSITTADVLRAASTAAPEMGFVLPSAATSAAFADEDLTAHLAEHVVVVGDGPITAAPIGVRELARIRDGYAPGQTVSGAFLSGYLQGKVVVAVLEAAVSRGDLSPSGVRAAAVGLRSVAFDELAPNARYGAPARRTPSTSSAVFRVIQGTATGLELVVADVVAPFADDLVAALTAAR